MIEVKRLLRNLDLGSSVAEFDDDLENYFVETAPFRDLVKGKGDIIAGDKGTGKTAIFKILQKRYKSIDTMSNIEVLAAFNPSGNPVFQKLSEVQALTEVEYSRLWKEYLLSFVGNWLLDFKNCPDTQSIQTLAYLLRGLDLRQKHEDPQSTFSVIIRRIGRFFRWKSAGVEVSMNDSGLPTFTPRVEFDNTSEGEQEAKNVSIEYSLRVLNKCIQDCNLSVWVVIDRLDEAFQGHQSIEIPALRALLRTYLDMLEFTNIRLKLFIRRDLFRRIIAGGFVNLTHINARRIEIIWDEEDLLSLLCRRIRENKEFCQNLGIEESNDDEIFAKLFPAQVDAGKRKPQTWKWIMRRIRDGNDIKPPRNLIDLISMAKAAQLRREDRDAREYEEAKPIIEGDALRRALTQLSDRRVQDTLLAEAGTYADLINKFRDGKAEHNDLSLADLLSVRISEVKATIKPLIELGFLEDVTGTFKVPSLYREGLRITQGKGFASVSNTAEADEDE